MCLLSGKAEWMEIASIRTILMLTVLTVRGYYRAVWILDISILEDTITMQLIKKI